MTCQTCRRPHISCVFAPSAVWIPSDAPARLSVLNLAIYKTMQSVDSRVTVLLISHGRSMKTPALPTPTFCWDDNRDGLLVRRSVLEELGYGVSVARNGEEGLKLFESAKFDVVVTDYRCRA